MSFHRRFRKAEHLRDLFVGETGKETQLHDFRFPRIVRRQLFQGLVQGEQLRIVQRRGEVQTVQIDSRGATAVALKVFAPGVINQNAAHRFGGGGKEVRAILPVRLGIAAQPQPGFVDERGGLQGLPRPFARHFRGGELPQFLVHKRQNFFRRARIALMGAVQDDSEFTHRWRSRGYRTVNTA